MWWSSKDPENGNFKLKIRMGGGGNKIPRLSVTKTEKETNDATHYSWHPMLNSKLMLCILRPPHRMQYCRHQSQFWALKTQWLRISLCRLEQPPHGLLLSHQHNWSTRLSDLERPNHRLRSSLPWVLGAVTLEHPSTACSNFYFHWTKTKKLVFYLQPILYFDLCSA